jgi:hypothetical protein
MTTTSSFEAAGRTAARALQSGEWLIRQPDIDAAEVILRQLWTPYKDVLEADEPDPGRVQARLEAVPGACTAALEVPDLDDRFTEMLRLLPKALADAGQDRAVRLLGGFGEVVFAIGSGPEVWV